MWQPCIKYSLLSTALENPWTLALSIALSITVLIEAIFQHLFRTVFTTIKQSFLLPTMTPNILISLMKFCYKMGFPFQNSPKNLDLSYKTDQDFFDCFEKKKNSVL